jgi:hypothetical protein
MDLAQKLIAQKTYNATKVENLSIECHLKLVEKRPLKN